MEDVSTELVVEPLGLRPKEIACVGSFNFCTFTFCKIVCYCFSTLISCEPDPIVVTSCLPIDLHVFCLILCPKTLLDVFERIK